MLSSSFEGMLIEEYPGCGIRIHLDEFIYLSIIYCCGIHAVSLYSTHAVSIP